MTPTTHARQAILDMKIARIIALFSEERHVTLSQAADLFYASSTARMIEDGVADLHCRSDKYLAEELYLELQRRGKFPAEPSPTLSSESAKHQQQ